MRKTFFGIDLFIFELMFCRILHALTSFSRYFTSTHSQACWPGRNNGATAAMKHCRSTTAAAVILSLLMPVI